MGRDLAQRAAAQRAGNGNGQDGEQEEQVRTLAAQLQRMAPEYQAAMPKGREATQLIRDAMTCLRNVKNLDRCEPTSVLGALMTCAQLDLRPGVLGHAWPLPFWDNRSKGYRAQLVIGYQGYIELGHRSGKLKDISARIVYWEDREWDFWEDEAGVHLIHKPALDGERVKVRSFYSTARLVSGGFQVTDPMSLASMEAHRDLYAPRDRNEKITGPWASNFGAMGRKTMVLRNFRLLPKSAEMVIAMEADDGVRINLDPGANAAEVTEHRVVPGAVEYDDEPDTPPPGPRTDLGDWADRIDDITSAEDGKRAEADLAEVTQSGTMTPDKAGAISRAIRAKVAMVGGDEPQ
jgi:recombination protein RecT